MSFSLHHHHHLPTYQHLLLAVAGMIALVLVTGVISTSTTTDSATPLDRSKFDQCANETYLCLLGKHNFYQHLNSTLTYCCCSHEWRNCNGKLNCQAPREYMRGSQESCDYISSLAAKVDTKTACPGGNYGVCLVNGGPPPPVTMSGTMIISVALFLMILMRAY